MSARRKPGAAEVRRLIKKHAAYVAALAELQHKYPHLARGYWAGLLQDRSFPELRRINGAHARAEDL